MPVTLVLASDEWFLGGQPGAPRKARGRGGGLAHHDTIARVEPRHGIDQLEPAPECGSRALDLIAINGSRVENADTARA